MTQKLPGKTETSFRRLRDKLGHLCTAIKETVDIETMNSSTKTELRAIMSDIMKLKDLKLCDNCEERKKMIQAKESEVARIIETLPENQRCDWREFWMNFLDRPSQSLLNLF